MFLIILRISTSSVSKMFLFLGIGYTLLNLSIFLSHALHGTSKFWSILVVLKFLHNSSLNCS